MPEGEKKHLNVERIVRLVAEGKISFDFAEALLKKIEEGNETSLLDVDTVDRSRQLDHAGGDKHREPETKWGDAVYVRVSASGEATGTSLEAQEVACARLAKSLGYCLDEADARRYVETGGDANA